MAVEHVWQYFWRIRAGASNFSEGITYQDVDAWSRLMGVELAGWEVSALISMGLAYADEKQKSDEKDNGEKRPSRTRS